MGVIEEMRIKMKLFPNSSLSIRFIGSFIVFLIPIVTVTLFINYYSLDILKKKSSESYGQSLDLLFAQVEGTLNKYQSIAYTLSIDQDLGAINLSPDDSNLIFKYDNLKKQLGFLMISDTLGSDLAVITPAKKLMFTSTGYVWDLKEYTNWPILNEQMITIQGWQFRDKNWPFLGAIPVITFFQRSSSSEGVSIEVNIPIENLKNFLAQSQNERNVLLFMYDNMSQELLYEGDLLNSKDDFIYKLQNNEKAKNEFEYEIFGELYQVMYKSSSFTGFTIGIMFPQEQLMSSIKWLRYLMLTVVFMIFLLAIVYTLISYKSVVAPIKHLITNMQKVSRGDFEVMMEVKEKNDFSFLYMQFNRMVSKINSLVNEVYMEKLKQQQVQLKLLQSQINPHFLYNCLNMVYQMSMSENHQGTAKLSLYLGRYFRYATKSNKDIVLLKDELDNIKTYIEIYKIQYEEKIIFFADVPEEMFLYYVPRLSVQPIVENAIIHGVEEDESLENHIWIRGYIKEDYFQLIIENDGIELGEEKIIDIKENLNHISQDGSGYGLNNTHWRLRLLFGELAGIQVEQREGGGMKVTLTIPIEASNHSEREINHV